MATTRDIFYVGGEYAQGRDGRQYMRGQMYVEHLVPLASITPQPYPLVFVHGGTRTGADWLTKPDGEPGWADYFLAQGYEVYLVDVPYRGRSPWDPTVGDVLTLSVEMAQSRFTAPAQFGTWPQAKLHTQWPGSGVQGDAVFDCFFASGVQMINDTEKQEQASQAALAALVDGIGKPVIFLSHSNGGATPLLVADIRPQLVKLVVAIEPSGPPFAASSAFKGTASQYGVTHAPITYEPPVLDPHEDLVRAVRKAGAPDLQDAILQADTPPPRKLINLAHIPVVIVTAEASYHAAYDWGTVEYLRQAGLQVEHLQLAGNGIRGNGHMMFMEKNSNEVAAEVDKSIRSHA